MIPLHLFCQSLDPNYKDPIDVLKLKNVISSDKKQESLNKNESIQYELLKK